MLCALALSVATSHARAETRLGLDLDYAHPLRAAGADPGVGFAVHAGAQAHLPFIVAVPEFVFTYDGFRGLAGPNTYRGLLGLRIGVGEVIRPSIFGHLGVGFLHLADSTRTALSYDAGLALDLTAIPLIDLGVHAGYNQIVSGSSRPSFQWLTLGAHAALVF